MKVVCLFALSLALLMWAVDCRSIHSQMVPRRRNVLWNDGTSYRERLQSWGLYPKVFRYGTTHHHRAPALLKRKDEMRWVKRLIREQDDQDFDSRAASNEVDESRRYNQEYEKFKEKLFHKIEQDAMEILWQHR